MGKINAKNAKLLGNYAKRALDAKNMSGLTKVMKDAGSFIGMSEKEMEGVIKRASSIHGGYKNALQSAEVEKLFERADAFDTFQRLSKYENSSASKLLNELSSTHNADASKVRNSLANAHNANAGDSGIAAKIESRLANESVRIENANEFEQLIAPHWDATEGRKELNKIKKSKQDLRTRKIIEQGEQENQRQFFEDEMEAHGQRLDEEAARRKATQESNVAKRLRPTEAYDADGNALGTVELAPADSTQASGDLSRSYEGSGQKNRNHRSKEQHEAAVERTRKAYEKFKNGQPEEKKSAGLKLKTLITGEGDASQKIAGRNTRLKEMEEANAKIRARNDKIERHNQKIVSSASNEPFQEFEQLYDKKSYYKFVKGNKNAAHSGEGVGETVNNMMNGDFSGISEFVHENQLAVAGALIGGAVLTAAILDDNE